MAFVVGALRLLSHSVSRGVDVLTMKEGTSGSLTLTSLVVRLLMAESVLASTSLSKRSSSRSACVISASPHLRERHGDQALDAPRKT